MVFAPVYLTALEDWEAVEPALIEVEKINGPILLISGEADRALPTKRLNEIALERLAANGFAYPVRHVVLPDSGHYFQAPYNPATDAGVVAGDLGGCPLAYDGSSAANAQANLVAWQEILDFLATAFATGLTK